MSTDDFLERALASVKFTFKTGTLPAWKEKLWKTIVAKDLQRFIDEQVARALEQASHGVESESVERYQAEFRRLKSMRGGQ